MKLFKFFIFLALALALAQAIAFWIMSILSTLESLALAKFNCLWYVNYKGMENFSNMAFYFMNACNKMYCAYLFTLQQHRFARMIQSMNKLRAFARKYSKVKEPRSRMIWVVLLFIFSMAISVLSVVFSIGVTDWTLEAALLDKAYYTAVYATIWTPEGFHNNGTGTQPEIDMYGTNLTTTNAMIGAGGMAMTICYRVYTEATGDLVLLTAITLNQQIHRLALEVGNPENDIFPVTMENFEAVGGQWEHYLLLEQAVNDTNATYDTLLKLMHVNNATLCVYLVINLFDERLSFFFFVYLLFNVIKTSCTYSIATKASQNNEIFQEWIRRLASKSSDPDFKLHLLFLLDHMKVNPLGLGKGQFLIDESFMFRFFGSVGSVFVLQAQSREAEQQ